MVEVSHLFWEEMIVSLGNTARPEPSACRLMRNLHHHVLVLLLAPAPVAQRGPSPPERAAQPPRCSAPPTHLRTGASSLHNPWGWGQGCGARFWLPGPLVHVQASKFISTMWR